MSNHEPRKMLRTSSSEGTATKQPESGTQVSPLKVPWAMLSVEVQRGRLVPRQLGSVAMATHSINRGTTTRSIADMTGIA
jgi:hypothetical protein